MAIIGYTNPMNTFDPKKFDAWRDRAGLSFNRLAALCARRGVFVTPQTLANWAAGRTRNPRLDLIQPVMAAMGGRLADVMTDEPEGETPLPQLQPSTTELF